MFPSRHGSFIDVATWFNLSLIISEIEDRWYPVGNGPLVLFTAVLYTAQGRQLSLRSRSVSLARALDPIAEMGMFQSPESHLLLYIADPVTGDRFVPLSGPLETDDAWAAAAIERLKASGATGAAGLRLGTETPECEPESSAGRHTRFPGSKGAEIQERLRAANTTPLSVSHGVSPVSIESERRCPATPGRDPWWVRPAPAAWASEPEQAAAWP